MHTIPQNVTSYEDKIVGSFVGRQFIYLAVGGVIVFILMSTPVGPLPIRFFLSLIIAGFAAALAMLKIQERGFDVWTMNFLKSVMGPTEWVWQKDAPPPSVLLAPDSVTPAQPATPLPTPEEASLGQRQKVDQYKLYLDTKNPDLDNEEQGFLNQLNFAEPIPASPIVMSAGTAPAPPMLTPNTPRPTPDQPEQPSSLPANPLVEPLTPLAQSTSQPMRTFDGLSQAVPVHQNQSVNRSLSRQLLSSALVPVPVHGELQLNLSPDYQKELANLIGFAPPNISVETVHHAGAALPTAAPEPVAPQANTPTPVLPISVPVAPQPTPEPAIAPPSPAVPLPVATPPAPVAPTLMPPPPPVAVTTPAVPDRPATGPSDTPAVASTNPLVQQQLDQMQAALDRENAQQAQRSTTPVIQPAPQEDEVVPLPEPTQQHLEEDAALHQQLEDYQHTIAALQEQNELAEQEAAQAQQQLDQMREQLEATPSNSPATAPALDIASATTPLPTPEPAINLEADSPEAGPVVIDPVAQAEVNSALAELDSTLPTPISTVETTTPPAPPLVTAEPAVTPSISLDTPEPLSTTTTPPPTPRVAAVAHELVLEPTADMLQAAEAAHTPELAAFPLPSVAPTAPAPVTPPPSVTVAAPTPQPIDDKLPPLTNQANVINGVVRGGAGEFLAGVVVVVKDDQGEPRRALKTNKLGQFVITTPLQNGTFIVEVDKKGLQFDIMKVSLHGQVLSPLLIQAHPA